MAAIQGSTSVTKLYDSPPQIQPRLSQLVQSVLFARPQSTYDRTFRSNSYDSSSVVSETQDYRRDSLTRGRTSMVSWVMESGLREKAVSEIWEASEKVSEVAIDPSKTI